MARKISVAIVGDSRSLEASFARASRAAGGFNRDLTRAGRGVLAVGVGYRSLARSVAFASSAFIGAAGLTAGLKASISGFSQFQNSMQQAVGLAGVGQKQIAGFSRQILGLAGNVGKSPQELAQAFYFVASSGIAASKAMGVVTAAAKASAAGLGETQVVADAVTSAMNAYGPSVLSAQKATDVLVSTVREGKGEADQFAGVIGNVAALASQLGVSFNEVGAALASETRLGVDAETAATQLQRVFSSLIKVTPQQAKAFKSVGLNADTLREQLGSKGLLFVLQEVKKAFGDNLPALAKAFGDQRAIRGVLALVGKQAEQVDGVFKRMVDTTGSLKTAFDAVSQDTAQQFRKLRASAEVAGISIGAIFAPLAGKVAASLAGAAQEFTGFLNTVNAQTTISGKLDVVFTGIKDTAAKAESALGAAVAAIDWNAVWGHARGIGDGLQKRLEQIDWGGVGSAIGDGIAKGVAGATTALKELAHRISDAIGAIDFVSLGKKMGPGLAAAVATAFVTLLDPVFWIHNWQLALSVGLVAFGGAVGRLAGKLGGDLALAILAPLERIAPRLAGVLLRGIVDLKGVASDAILGVAGSIERVAPRLGTAVLSGFLRLGELVQQALAPLERIVGRQFNRLGKLAQFVVKVLGIEAAIHAITGFIGHIAQLIGHGLDDAWDAMKRKALKAALDIVEPFSHLPAFLGGWARDAKTALQQQLDGMVKASQSAGAAISKALTGVTSTGNVAAETAASPNRAGAGVAQAIPKPARQKLDSSVAAATQAASTAATTAVEKGFVLPFRLQLAQAKAETTASAADDVSVAKQIRAFILKAIPKLNGQKLIDAYQQLGQVNKTIAGAVSAAAKSIGGFTVPLALQVAQARAEALGKDDTLKRVLERIRAAAQKALKSGHLGLQGQLDAWNQIFAVNDQLKNQVQAFATKFQKASTKKLVAGLDLSTDDIKKLRARLSQVGPNGTVPTAGFGAFGVPVTAGGDIIVHTSVDLDGQKVGKSVTRHQQRSRRRNPQQRRGFAGAF